MGNVLYTRMYIRDQISHSIPFSTIIIQTEVLKLINAIKAEREETAAAEEKLKASKGETSVQEKLEATKGETSGQEKLEARHQGKKNLRQVKEKHQS